MPYSKCSSDSLASFLARHLPAAQVAGSFTRLSGLSGGSQLIHTPQANYLARHRNPAMPRFVFTRQYRALRRLPAGFAPRACAQEGNWLLVEYLPGEIKTQLPCMPQLATLLYHLHRQPRFGWRINIAVLLLQFWHKCSSGRRTPFWLKRLSAMVKRGEPLPLRLAPLHMDVHPGNLVWMEEGVKLIDWEYAGDGDVALELAAVWLSQPERKRLVTAYAEQAGIDEAALWRQVSRWRPWVGMLMAGWYEQRFQETRQEQFIVLADDVWRQLRAE